MARLIACVDPIRRGGGSASARARHAWPCVAVSQDPPRSQSRDRVSSLLREEAGTGDVRRVLSPTSPKGRRPQTATRRVIRLRVPGNRFSATWASFLT